MRTSPLATPFWMPGTPPFSIVSAALRVLFPGKRSPKLATLAAVQLCVPGRCIPLVAASPCP